MIQSTHYVWLPVNDPHKDYFLDAGEGNDKTALYFSQIELSGTTIEIYNADTNELLHTIPETSVVPPGSEEGGGGLWTNDPNAPLHYDNETTGFWYPARRLKIRHVYTWGTTDPGYGFRITRYRVGKQSNVMMVSNQQSIASYVLPMDESVLNDIVPPETIPNPPRGHRDEDESVYKWEFPKGWGVHRIPSITIECKTPNATYEFQKVVNYRRTSTEGGFAYCYVFPHQPAMNDRNRLDDVAWRYAGLIKQYSESEGAYDNPRYLIPKAFVVIDGVIAFEIFAGSCEELNTRALLNEQRYGPYYRTIPFQFLDNDWSVPLYALPLKKYPVESADNSYDVNGVVSVEVDGTAAGSSFCRTNSFATYLGKATGGVFATGGIIEAVEDRIELCYRMQVDVIRMDYGLGGTAAAPSSQYKTLHARVFGLAYQENGQPAANRQVQIKETRTKDLATDEPTDVVTHTVNTNALGHWVSPPIKCRYPAEIIVDGNSSLLDSRNREYMRLAIVTASNTSIPGESSAIAETRGGSRIYLAYNTESGVKLRIYHGDQKTYIERDTFAEIPTGAVDICLRYGQVETLVITYVKDGAIKQSISSNDGKDWSVPEVLWNGASPDVDYGVGDNAEVCAYLNTATNKVCVRTKRGTGAYGAEVVVADADANTSVCIRYYHNNRKGFWVLIFTTGTGTVHRYTSTNAGRSWTLDE
jgi:hypothetical protein